MDNDVYGHVNNVVDSSWFDTADNAWLWVAAMGAPIVVVPIVLIVLTRTRATHDANERLRLKIS